MLCVAEALAFAADWRDPGQGIVALGLAIIGVVIVNRLFSFWQANTMPNGRSPRCRSCCHVPPRRCATAALSASQPRSLCWVT
jgi:hypothetical protein